MQHTFAVIMAGGGGTRLWPISRRKHPKHLLPLLGERTFFQGTLDRLEGLLPSDRIYVVTTGEQSEELKGQATSIPLENFLIEPMPRGTASVTGLAAEVIAKRDPKGVMLVLPSDHFINNRDLFHRLLRVAVAAARKDYLVTLGIPPTFPSTGYGYIKRGAALPEHFDTPVYRVLKFIEKPDDISARELLKGREHSWNSGMFIWRADRILDEFSRQMPTLSEALHRIGAAWGTKKQNQVLKAEWIKLPSETIDYGIMEHAGNVAVILADGLDWSDIGSWESLFDVLPHDKDGNVVLNGDHLSFETQRSLVYSSEKKLIVTIGVDDLIVIDSGDALLVCRRDQSQQVRQVIATLKKSKREEYL